MNDTWWDAGRATGIVALALAVAALVYGFFFSSRNTGERRRPAWWLDLHNWLGGLTLLFTIVHVVAIWLDRTSGIDAVQALLPGTASDARWAITWGVLATYLFVLTVVTSWPRKRLGRRTWRIVHLTSVGATVLAGIHTFQVGSDASSVYVQGGLVAGTALLVYAATVRTLAVFVARRA